MADYPIPKFHFQVEWGGSVLLFQAVSGLDVEPGVIEFHHGHSPSFSAVGMPGGSLRHRPAPPDAGPSPAAI